MEIILVVLFILAVAIYFSPMIIALHYDRKQAAAIIVLNIFLGWTFLGWVVALTWACIDDKKQEF